MDAIRVEPSATPAARVRPPHLRRDVVSRPRLLDLLDSGVRREVTLVSAPAGFGKTTLLAEWAATSMRPVAWLALAEADTDPAVLRAEVVAALGRVERSERVVLVLDGYEEIAGSAADGALSELLRDTPAGLQIVISGRVDPPFPLGDALEIRASDLRMTELEAAELLHRALGESLAVREVLRRIDGCDGVPGALRAAADAEAEATRGRAERARAGRAPPARGRPLDAGDRARARRVVRRRSRLYESDLPQARRLVSGRGGCPGARVRRRLTSHILVQRDILSHGEPPRPGPRGEHRVRKSRRAMTTEHTGVRPRPPVSTDGPREISLPALPEAWSEESVEAAAAADHEIRGHPFAGTLLARRQTTISELTILASALVVATVVAAVVASGTVVGSKTGFASLLVLTVIAYVIAGLAWRRARPWSPLGPLLVAFGFFCAVISLDALSSPIAHSIGVLAEAPITFFLVWLVLAFPSGRLDRISRIVLGAVGAVLVFGFVAKTLLVPMIQPMLPLARCAAACPANTLRIAHDATLADVAHWIDTVGRVGVFAVVLGSSPIGS